jgi:hypothetical protein
METKTNKEEETKRTSDYRLHENSKSVGKDYYYALGWHDADMGLHHDVGSQELSEEEEAHYTRGYWACRRQENIAAVVFSVGMLIAFICLLVFALKGLK